MDQFVKQLKAHKQWLQNRIVAVDLLLEEEQMLPNGQPKEKPISNRPMSLKELEGKLRNRNGHQTITMKVAEIFANTDEVLSTRQLRSRCHTKNGATVNSACSRLMKFGYLKRVGIGKYKRAK